MDRGCQEKILGVEFDIIEAKPWKTCLDLPQKIKTSLDSRTSLVPIQELGEASYYGPWMSTLGVDY